MKYLLTILFLLSIDNLIAQDIEEVLKNTAASLNKVRTIRYDYRRELSYSSENYHHVGGITIYLDFTDNGFKYQMDNEQLTSVYNGAEQFVIYKGDKMMDIRSNPAHGANSFLYNSIITWKKALPVILKDSAIGKTVTDTVINNKPYYLISLSLYKQTLDGLGHFIELTKDRHIIYKLLVNKDTYLPETVIQSNDVDSDYTRVDFTNIQLSPVQPMERSWYYSTYAGEYKERVKKEIKVPPIGTPAPEWKLPLHASADSLQLRSFRGKPVLLEFWIKNCGYCIEAVPALNKLAKRCTVLGINVNDSKEDIDFFIKKNKPEYKILDDGHTISEQYGVAYYPAVILIDKNGRVRYAGSFDITAIEKLLD